MNRQQRRAEAARKRKWGTAADIITHTITVHPTGELYWFEAPEGFSPEEGRLPPGVILHGPFKTHAEVAEDERLTLFGPQCKVTDGGAWDPAWDRPQ